MVKYGSKWLNMVQYGSKCLNMVQYSINYYIYIYKKKIKIKKILCKIVKYGSIWFKKIHYGSNWSPVGATAVGLIVV